jgi:hypothetical protein
MFPPSFDRPRGQAAGAGSFSPAEMEILSLGIIPFAFAGCRFRPSGQVKHARKLINEGENSRRVARSFGVDPLDALSEFRQAGRMKRVASRAAELHLTVFEVRVQGRRLVSTDPACRSAMGCAGRRAGGRRGGDRGSRNRPYHRALRITARRFKAANRARIKRLNDDPAFRAAAGRAANAARP